MASVEEQLALINYRLDRIEHQLHISPAESSQKSNQPSRAAQMKHSLTSYLAPLIFW